MSNITTILLEAYDELRYKFRLMLFNSLSAISDSSPEFLCHSMMRSNEFILTGVMDVLQELKFLPPSDQNAIVVSYMDEFINITTKHSELSQVCNVSINLRPRGGCYELVFDLSRHLGGAISSRINEDKMIGCDLSDFKDLLSKSMEELK